MNIEDSSKLNAHLKAISTAEKQGAKAGKTVRNDFLAKLALKPGAKVRILGNYPELGRYPHYYKTGQIVSIMQWMPLASGKLPQCTNNRKGRRMMNNVVDLPQFEIA